MRNRRILYYSPHPHLNLGAPAGYATHMREMIFAFQHLGYQVDKKIVGGLEYHSSEPANSSGPKSFIKKLIPPILWESLKDKSLLQRDQALYKELLRESHSEIDWIYERGYYLMTSGVRFAGKKRIFHCLELNAPYVDERVMMGGNSWYKYSALQAEKFMVESTDLLVVVSSALKDYFTSTHKIPKSKVLVTPNAVNLDYIKFNNKEVEHIKQKHKLSNSQVIGFVGSIFPYHGVDKLIAAFNQVKSQSVDSPVKLLIVGDGESLPELKIQAKKLGIQDSIVFTGNVPSTEVFNYIECMDICILADSKWYCSPIKLFEYGALKKPIVAPKTQAVLDVMEHNKNAILIENQDQLVNALLQLLHQKDFRNKLADNFYNQVISHHTWGAMAQLIKDKIKDVKASIDSNKIKTTL